MKFLKTSALALVCCMAGGAPLLAQEAQRPAGSGVALREIDIRAFIEDVSNATGRTFIVDPRVNGRVTITAQQSLSPEDLFQVFMSTLRVNGFVAVATASGAYRIVPDAIAAREPSANNGSDLENTYVTQVLPLRFADAESAATALRPMLSERGQITASRRGNSLIVVDYGSTINRVRDVVARLDKDNSSFRTIRLRNTSPTEMARVAQSLATGIGEDANRSLLQAVPVASSNSLILRGDERTIAAVLPLLEQLDSQADFQSAVQVLPLRYAVAEELVPILQQLSTAMDQAVGRDQTQTAGRRANIAAHRATNSLIINADPETQEALAKVVRTLDVRRQQILVEAIIVEVSDSIANDLGLQFLAADPSGSNSIPFLSTNYSSASAPSLLSMTGALVIREKKDGDNTALEELRRAAVSSLLGASGIIAGVGGTDSNGRIFGLLLNALHQDKDSNVLSTPSVMTLDNEKASILVGQQIPITTGEAVGANLENQFRTVRREDVGVQLEVRPQISSDNGAIRLQIRQEVSSIFGPVISDSTDLITNRREIETVVQVDPGQIIVLGGLIQEDIQRDVSGIPGLSQIPVAGRLFRSESKSRRRTNLMVFLRPTVVNTPEQAAAITSQQARLVQGRQGIDPSVARQLADALRPASAAPLVQSAPTPLQPTAAPPAP